MTIKHQIEGNSNRSLVKLETTDVFLVIFKSFGSSNSVLVARNFFRLEYHDGYKDLFNGAYLEDLGQDKFNSVQTSLLSFPILEMTKILSSYEVKRREFLRKKGLI